MQDVEQKDEDDAGHEAVGRAPGTVSGSQTVDEILAKVHTGVKD